MNIVLGIDFGTSNTVISYFNNNKPNILLDGNFKVIKTKIGIKNNLYTCGNYLSLDNDELIYNFKTKIGTEELDNILIIFFDHLKKLILKKFNNIPNICLKTVITVPSNFNDLQRKIIKKNFIYAGFDIIRIINEPSAAALSYGLGLNNLINNSELDNDNKILVFDLGAGTLDISILLKDNNFYEVKHSIGLNDLGGNNFTELIYKFILTQINVSNIELYNKIINDKKIENKLWYVCQNAKEKLSWLDNYEIKIDNFIFNLNVTKFENLCDVLFDKLILLLTDIKNNYYESIQYIIMVGNSSKIPKIKTIINNIFNIEPWLHPNLESVVAEGACLYSAILQNVYKTEENIVLLDILPLSLGVEMADGNFSIIIPKNTPLPIKKTNKYTTDSPDLNNVIVKIYQGERLIANKNTLIGKFIFDKVSIGGSPQIYITFKVDTNSMITVTVVDRKSGDEKNILIKDIPKLDEDEIKLIINNANINNKIDEEEIIRCNRTYLLNNKIELAMTNVSNNNLLNENKKQEILNDLLELELKIADSNNITLLNMINYIDETYSNIIKNNTQNDETEDLEEKTLLNELKFSLKNKINLLINKNPEWTEYLNPILDDLSYTNISLDYIHDKLDIIKDLEETTVIDENYYDQFKNVCLFIKSQIEEGLIIFNDLNKLDELTDLVNLSLILIENNDINTNWQDQLNLFNEKCELINSI
jgi:molecular chaperone DnaK